MDWGAPSNVLDKDDLKLDWSENDDEEETDERNKIENKTSTPNKLIAPDLSRDQNYLSTVSF